MRFALLLSLVVAASCATAAPPTREADITGTVTQVSDDRSTILVEERPQEQSGSAKASVRITTSTHVWRDAVNGTARAALASDLSLGTVVRVWFDGPVATSYPVQAKAGDIVIDAGTSQGASLYVLSKGGPNVAVRVNGFEAAHVPCNGGAAIRPRADLTPDLPWEVVVVRTGDGAVLLDQRVTSLPKWLLVQPGAAGISEAPISGPFVPCP